LLLASLLGSPGDFRFQLTVQGEPNLTVAVRAADDGACVLQIANQTAQWRVVQSGADNPGGASAYVPGRAATHVVVLSAGLSVIAVLHDKSTGRLLAKVAGRCGRATGRVEVSGASRVVDKRDIGLCAKTTFGDPAYFTGTVDTPTTLYTFEERDGRALVRLELATLARLACKDKVALDVTADLPWKHEDVAFFEADRAFAKDGKLSRSSYWSPEMVNTALSELAAAHPRDARLVTIATTRQGRPVRALAIGTALREEDDRPSILLNGGHHGDELIATSIVMDAAKALLTDKRLKKARDHVVFWCVPIVNPDGLHMFLRTSVRAGRKNGHDADGDGQRGVHDGVDLNRNYPFGWRTTASNGPKGDEPLGRMYPGPGPASEPETQGMMELAARERFVAAISYHMGTVALLAPYTVGTATDPTPNEALTVAEDVVKSLPPHPEGKTLQVKKKLYEVDGTDQDWHRHAHGTVALLAEVASWPPPQDPRKRDAIIRWSGQLWRQLAKRFTDGPSLTIKSPGTVAIDGQKLTNGERWTPRPRDNLTARFVTAGRHTLSFEKDGERWSRAVTVGNKNLQVE
jgi:hypothetical protein